ncbi:hypothetical protein, partial [Microtetraspora fusca]|uniref:hypothetical protein n=1 Tax=Microtetraspora fusca TaxID=1997 RepID=UPI001C3F18A6
MSESVSVVADDSAADAGSAEDAARVEDELASASAVEDESPLGAEAEAAAGRSSSTSDAAGQCGEGRGPGVSWPLVAQVREVASAVAVALVPDAPQVCLAEAEDLLFARDRLISAIAARVERVHAAGEARRGGHASTRSWLRG